MMRQIRNLAKVSLFFAIICSSSVRRSYAADENTCTEFNPCKNMANCFRFENDPTRVKCVCKRGFNGNLCEICKCLYEHSA